MFTHLFRDEGKVVDNVVGAARKLGPELRLLGANPDGARVEVADPGHDAAGRDHGHGAKAKLFRAL